jgi:plasmid stabilization system protein ParE
MIYQSKFAAKSVQKIANYISTQGNPDNALRYILKLQKFINSLVIYPEKVGLCKQVSFAKRNYYCAVFDKTYIIVYKIKGNDIYIYNVIHGSRLR